VRKTKDAVTVKTKGQVKGNFSLTAKTKRPEKQIRKIE